MPPLFKKLFKPVSALETLRAFMEQWGIWPWVTALSSLCLATGLSMWAWLVSSLPLWGVVLVLLGALVIILAVFNLSIEAYRKISAEKLDHQAIAVELINLSDEMTRAINDYVRSRIIHSRDVTGLDDQNSRDRWQRSVQEGEMLIKHIGERFGRRMIAAVILLRRLDISVPFHLSHMSEHTIMGTAAFFGAVGQLIKSGNLAAAQKLDDQVSWDISNIVR